MKIRRFEFAYIFILRLFFCVGAEQNLIIKKKKTSPNDSNRILLKKPLQLSQQEKKKRSGKSFCENGDDNHPRLLLSNNGQSHYQTRNKKKELLNQKLFVRSLYMYNASFISSFDDLFLSLFGCDFRPNTLFPCDEFMIRSIFFSSASHGTGIERTRIESKNRRER